MLAYWKQVFYLKILSKYSYHEKMPIATSGNLVLDFATESDAKDLGEMYFLAFNHAFYKAMCPRTSESENAWTTATGNILRDPMSMNFKVTDITTSKVVAMGRWLKPREPNQKEQPGTAPDRYDPIPGCCDEELATALFGCFAEHRAKMMGNRRHYYMELLATDPKYQGQGAASLVLKYGCDLADRDGLECYIDASPKGLPLYEKFGWVFPPEEILKMPRYDEFGYEEAFGIRQPRKLS